MKALPLSLLLLLGCEQEVCPEQDIAAYRVPLVVKLSPEERMWAELETCYLPKAGTPVLCASGANHDWALRFAENDRDGVSVLVSSPLEDKLTVTWRWTQATWLEAGDRYSLKVIKGDQVLFERTEAVEYDVQHGDPVDTGSACSTEREVGRLEF